MKYVVLINKTKKTSLGRYDFAKSFISRLWGLMFKEDLQKGLILKLPKHRSRKGSAIHMFFMKFPLDIVFIDSNKKVVDMISIEPWKTYTPLVPARYVIEMEKVTINKFNIGIGDELDFTYECI